MRALGVWGDVAVLTASDFGRTLGSNGAGTDHAWGGHYWLAGGSVAGGQVLGTYPAALDESSEVNIGRNHRMLPTTPWEAVWHGLGQWFGAGEAALRAVVPNAANFAPASLFNASNLIRAAR